MANKISDLTIRDLDGALQELGERYSHFHDDDLFVLWFLRAYVTDSEDRAAESITGGSKDKGVDALLVDDAARAIFIVQGKYHLSNKFSEPRSHIIALADLGRSIVSDRRESFQALLNKANPIVKKLLEESHNLIHKRNYQLVLRYVTTGKISKTHFEEGESRFEDFDNARFETYSFNDLMKLMQDYIKSLNE